MSSREKRLLALFGVAGFLMLHFLAFQWFQTKKQDVASRLLKAERMRMTAQMVSESRDQVKGEMEWLREHEPKPAANQDVQTQLQKFCEREAVAAGMVIRLQRPIPTDTTAGHAYHRAKFQFTVSGTEESLYRWFDRVNVPEDFRIASQIRLAPNKEDDTKIDCTVVVEQWFVPAPPSA